MDDKLRDVLRKARLFIECSPLKTVESNSGRLERDKICAEIDAILFWMGRQVEKVYSMGESVERWWSVPIPAAVRSLLKRGKAKRVKTIPTPEGELPR